MPPTLISNYIICATARSGSNWLCELLSSLGFAGRPDEHFWDPPDAKPEPLAQRWQRVLRAGTGENGVFGLKLLWYQADRLERELPPALGMPDRHLTDVLVDVLDEPRYIYLTRRDQLRQAISFARAMQTKQWRSTDRVVGEPHYDPATIAHGLGFLRHEEDGWETFFARNTLSPYRIAYEDLDSAPAEKVSGLLTYLGYPVSMRVTLSPSRHQRQADALTEQWVRRYTTDQLEMR